MPLLIESLEEYTARHGGRFLKVAANRWVAPNGAVIREDALGRRGYEPHTEPGPRLAVQREYAEAALELAEETLDRLRAALLGEKVDGLRAEFVWDERVTREFGPVPQPEGDGPAAVRALKRAVRERREALARIEEEIEALPENVEKARRRLAQRRFERETAREEEARREAVKKALKED